MSDYVYENDEQDHRGWRADPFEGQPIDVPLGDVTGVPRRCVEIADDWVPIIISALERLKFGDMWNGDAADIARAVDNIDTLQVNLAQGDCVGGNMDYECIDLPMHAPNVDFLPADPFDDPDEIPFGYTQPPWKISPFDDPVNGILAGDVIVNPITALTSFPPVVPVTGVPRFQITVQGPAEVDLSFVRVLQGGIAIVFIDGVPNHWYDCQLYNVGDLLNVNSWLELFGFVFDTFTRPQLQDGIVLPLAQEYVIEAQMFPRPALDFSLGYGGGIRAIQICSAEEQIDLSAFVTDVRLNAGVLEKEIDGGWVAAEAVSDHVDASLLVRGNGCEIEGLRAWDATWIGLPDTDFVDQTMSCFFSAAVRTTAASTTGLRHDRAGFTSVTMGIPGNNASVWAGNGRISLWGFPNDAIMGFNAAGHAGVAENGLDTLWAAMWHIRNSSASRVPLLVEQYANTPPALIQVKNSAGTIVSETSPEGWFSAMQQLIVNDLTSTAAKRAQGRLLGQWADDTDATRKGRLALQVDDFAGAREVIRAEADGVQPLLGFNGVAAIPRPVIDRDYWLPDEDTRLLLTELHNLGLIQWIRATLPINTDWSYLHTALLPDLGLDQWLEEDAALCGIYTAGVGIFGEANCGAFNYRGRWAFDFTSNAQLTFARYEVVITASFAFPLTVRLNRANGTAIRSDTIDPANAGTYEFTWTGDEGVTQIELQLDNADDAGIAYISRIQIAGTGVYPGPKHGYELADGT